MRIEPVSIDRKPNGDVVMVADMVSGWLFRRRERVTWFGRLNGEPGSALRSRRWAIVHPYQRYAKNARELAAVHSVVDAALDDAWRREKLSELVSEYEKTYGDSNDPR